VKPLRGKRTELGESVVVIQPVRSRAPVHLAAAERDDRPSGRLKPVGKVAARSRARCYRPSRCWLTGAG
jgi:hypothetical protein